MNQLTHIDQMLAHLPAPKERLVDENLYQKCRLLYYRKRSMYEPHIQNARGDRVAQQTSQTIYDMLLLYLVLIMVRYSYGVVAAHQ